MSCTTLYLTRGANNRLFAAAEKYGEVVWISPEQVRAHLSDRHRELRPVESLAAWRASTFCRGVYLDPLLRVFRCYLCYGTYQLAHNAEAIRRALRGAAWQGWDATYADAAVEEVVAIASGADPVCPLTAPSLEGLGQALAQPVLDRGDLDEAGWSIRYHAEEQYEEDWLSSPLVLTGVGADGRSQDWVFKREELAGWLLCGPKLFEALLQFSPVPPIQEHSVTQGAVIDLPERRLRWWTGERLPVGWVEAVRAAWPGWQVEREPDLYPGQLARAGRDPAPWCLTPAELGGLAGALGRAEGWPRVWPRRAIDYRFREE